MMSSNVWRVGLVVSASRRSVYASEIPRTRSALPTLARYEPSVGAEAAYSAVVNGVCHTCIGWIRVGSCDIARKTTILPSLKRLYPWHWIGVAISLRIRLYG